MVSFDTNKVRYVDIIFPWDEELCNVLPEEVEYDGETATEQIPLVCNGYWHGMIDLKEHRILNLKPSLSLVAIQAKVRDSGIYTLLDEEKYPLCCYRGYVPEFPFDEDKAWGDYIFLFFDANGEIQRWTKDFKFKTFQEKGNPISIVEFEQMKKFYLTSDNSNPSTDENSLVVLAARIMLAAHNSQVDKAGQPYFWHPMRVAVKCETPKQKIVALLHDTLEDTDVTPEYLLAQGFPNYIIEAIQSVTRNDGETYEKFVERCALNPIGRMVKIHDLQDNMDITRLNVLSDKDLARLNKYLHAYKVLTENSNKQPL